METVISCGPDGALDGILKVTVIWLAVVFRLLRLMPAPTLTDPLLRLKPVNVTVILCPGVALAGFMVVITGAGGSTEKFNWLVVPAAVVKVRFRAPKDATGSTTKVAVTNCADVITLLIVIPDSGLMVAPSRLKPLMATDMLAPRDPISGLIEVSTGTVKFMAQYPPKRFTQFCWIR